MIAEPKLLPCLWMFSSLCSFSRPAVSWSPSPSRDKRLFDVLLHSFIYKSYDSLALMSAELTKKRKLYEFSHPLDLLLLISLKLVSDQAKLI